MKNRLRSCLSQLRAFIFGLAVLAALSGCMQSTDGRFEILTPGNFENLTQLTDISGTWRLGSHAGAIESVNLTLMRYSDNTYWNGSSWGSSFNLPITFDTSTWHIAAGTNLPAGTELQAGYYLITADVDFDDGSMEANRMFAVGVQAPPVQPTAWVWGNGANGQLGIGSVDETSFPVPIFMRGALEGKLLLGMAAGANHTLALTSEGRVYAWGEDGDGQIGSMAPHDGPGTTFVAAINWKPVKVDDTGVLAGKYVSRIAAGVGHSLALSSDGLVFGWGANDYGQLGTGSSATEFGLPVAVSTLQDVTAISAGYHHSIALDENGTVYTWGDNTSLQLGNGSTTGSVTPMAVMGTGPAGMEFIAVAAGSSHNLALANDGRVYAWGEGESGQLGNGGTADVGVPTLIPGPWGVRRIIYVAAGGDHSLSVDEDGRAYAWGKNVEGQLGTGDEIQRLTPVQVTGALAGQHVLYVKGGSDFSAAVTRENKIFTWGSNGKSQLARPTLPAAFSNTPQEAGIASALSGGREVLHFSLGSSHAAVLTGFPPEPAPEIEVEAQGVELTDGGTLNFGNVGQGSSTPIFITVRNRGTSDLTGLSATISGAGFSGVFTQPGLAPNGETGFYVFFQPNAAGPANGTLQILSNDTDENPFDITLTGSAYPVGQVDMPFNPGMTADVNAISVQPDGKVIVGGGFVQVAGPTARNHCARLDAVTGAADAFNPSAGDVGQFINCSLVLPDGKVMIGGNFTSVSGVARSKLARLNADGTLDTAYNAPLTGTFGVRGMALQSDGKLIIVGNIGSVAGVSISYIARLNPDGTRDASFNPLPNAPPLGVTVRGDGQVLIWGQFTTVNGVARSGVALLNGANGTLDTSFANPLITFSGQITTAALQPNGKILVGGNVSAVNGVTRHGMCRLNPDGTLDTTFDPDINSETRSIALQADGSMIICGFFTSVGGQIRNRIAKLKANGALDAYFNPNANSVMLAAAVQADGKVLVSGVFSSIGGESRGYLARLSNDAATQSLSVTNNGATIEWLRGGASPETHLVTFDVSSDGGTTWTELGAASRVAFPQPGWVLTSGALPATGHLRARAYCQGSYYNGSTSIMQTITSYGTPPDIVVTENSVPVIQGATRQFGVVATGSGSSLMQLTIQNTGGTTLTGLGGVTLDDDLSVVGEHQTQFQLGRPAASSLAPGATTTLSVIYRPKTSGHHAAILRIPSNDSDTPIFGIFLSGTGSQPITTWKQIHHGQTENTGIAADDADLADNDGNTELEEYAFNLNPNAPDKPQMALTLTPGSAPSSPEAGETASDSPSSGVLQFDYTRNRLALADVTFQVEWSDTLAANDWHTENVTEEILSETATEQQIRATLPCGSSGRRFVRLRLSR